MECFGVSFVHAFVGKMLNFPF